MRRLAQIAKVAVVIQTYTSDKMPMLDAHNMLTTKRKVEFHDIRENVHWKQ